MRLPARPGVTPTPAPIPSARGVAAMSLREKQKVMAAAITEFAERRKTYSRRFFIQRETGQRTIVRGSGLFESRSYLIGRQLQQVALLAARPRADPDHGVCQK